MGLLSHRQQRPLCGNRRKKIRQRKNRTILPLLRYSAFRYGTRGNTAERECLRPILANCYPYRCGLPATTNTTMPYNRGYRTKSLRGSSGYHRMPYTDSRRMYYSRVCQPSTIYMAHALVVACIPALNRVESHFLQESMGATFIIQFKNIICQVFHFHGIGKLSLLHEYDHTEHRIQNRKSLPDNILLTYHNRDLLQPKNNKISSDGQSVQILFLSLHPEKRQALRHGMRHLHARNGRQAHL